MVIKGVEEKYNSLNEIGFYQNSSAFVLCFYKKNDDNKKELEIIPLENKLNNIKIEKGELFLTDKSGNLLLKFEDLKYRNVLINYVNQDDIIISEYDIIRPKFVPKKIFMSIDHFSYDSDSKELKFNNNLYNNKNKKLNKFEFPNSDIETIMIDTVENFKTNSVLYSIKDKKYISPTFSSLEEVDMNGTLFKYTDRIKCSLVIDGLSFSSNIIGFISINGKFYNGVYDELSNKEIECELNNKPNFEEYYDLKNMIEGKLNEKVVKESNKMTTKEFVLKKIENKAKSNLK